MTTDNNKINVDQAWNKLQTRLINDELMPDTTPTKPNKTLFRWIGIAAMLCICGYLAIYQLSHTTATPLLTLQNNESQNTLVTTLTDGSIVYLWSGASLSYPQYFAKDKRQVELTGEALFDITGNPEHPFIIETEHILVEVLGTSFNIKSESKKPFELSVKHGSVKVTEKKTGVSQTILAGETVRLEKGRLLKSKISSPDIFDTYIRDLQFRDETLSNVLKVLNKNGNQPVILTDLSAEDRKLTGTIHFASLDTVVELICTAMNLTWTEKQDTLFISQPRKD